MIVKIGNKEVQLTDYLSANQIQKALYETYEQGYQDGGSDMEQAKQIIIDSLLKQIEQIRAEVIDECIEAINKLNIEYAYPHTICNILEMLKERSNDR